MASWKDLLVDVIKLTDEVKRLNRTTDLLAERTIDIDKRLVRLETVVEMGGQGQQEQQGRLPKPE